MNPLITKLIVTAGAVGIYVISHYFADLKDLLLPLAGGLVGGMWMNAPGTVKIAALAADPVPLKDLPNPGDPK